MCDILDFISTSCHVTVCLLEAIGNIDTGIHIYIIYPYIYIYCSLISPSPLQPSSFVSLVISPSQTGWSNRSGAGLGGSSWRRRCRDRVNLYTLPETNIILWIILWIYCTINILIWWYISG